MTKSKDSEFSTLLRQVGKTQKQLADELGINPATVTHWKDGNVPQYATAYLSQCDTVNKFASSITQTSQSLTSLGDMPISAQSVGARLAALIEGIENDNQEKE